MATNLRISVARGRFLGAVSIEKCLSKILKIEAGKDGSCILRIKCGQLIDVLLRYNRLDCNKRVVYVKLLPFSLME